MFKTYSMDTAIGAVELTPTAFDSVSIKIAEAVVRGVTYRAGLHAKREGEKWQLERNPADVMIRRPDKKHGFFVPSESAKRVILDTAESATLKWIYDNPKIFTALKREKLVSTCQASGNAIVRLKQELKEAELAWQNAVDALCEFDLPNG